MDTDFQVRLDFLEEAEEYFNSLESLLMDLDSQGANPSLLDSAMRAAHSLKGGAAMMRFEPLSKIAHRLEDFLKILRVRKDDSLIDRETTNLLLKGVDCLREARNLHREQVEIDDAWFANHSDPIFESLQLRLGDLKQEDEDLLLAEEEQVDVSSLIFQSGVEDCLESFESQIEVLELPRLKEELAVQAEQLAEFGQMSQIEEFVSLCQSVLAQLKVVPLEDIRELAREAFKLWERSHALVLVGRLDKLPTSLNGVTSPSETNESNIPSPDIGDLLDAEGLTEIQNFAAQELAPELPLSNNELDLDELTPSAEELSQLDAAFLSPDNFAAISQEDSSSLEEIDLDEFAPDSEELSELNAAFASTDDSETSPVAIDLDELTPDATELSELNNAFAAIEVNPIQEKSTTKLPLEESSKSQTVAQSQPSKESGRMVRVPAERLENLNNLSSRLILERNAAVLRLNQLQNYVSLARERMRRLEQSSNQLRKLYDWASLEGMIAPTPSVGVTVNPAWEEVSNFTTNATDSTSEKFDALEMDRYSDLHLLSQEQMETIVQLQEVTADIDLSIREMGQVIRNFSYTTQDLQQNVTRSQMRPFGELVARFPRLIRDLSAQYNKQANLIIEGKSTYIDRQAFESLSDPLTHLLRNAFDHGLEDKETRLEGGKPAEGTIILNAKQQGNRTIITITDDGGGINTEKIRDRLMKLGFSQTQVNEISETDILDAIFEPGFSTAERVTELSGRGVGMDVVRSNLETIRGDIQVQTELGKGTTFIISVPLSLLVLRVIIVETAGLVFAIPVNSIKEIINYEEELILQQDEQEQIVWGEKFIPLLRLDKYLRFQRPHKSFDMEGNPKIATPTVLIFESDAKLQGIYLEKYWSEQEVAIRTVKTSIPLFAGFSGSTLLGDGRVIPLIEPVALSKGIAKQYRKSLSTLTEVPNKDLSDDFIFSSSHNSTILVVDDSVNVRRYLAGILERNGYQVEEAKDGRDAVDKLMAGLEVEAIICDVEMPRLDGYGVLSEVKSEPNLETIPIAMLTSRSNDKHRKLAMKLGASAYFSKPFNEQEMLETLATLITSN